MAKPPDDPLILLPVRNLVLFPGMVLPIVLGRNASIAALSVCRKPARVSGVMSSPPSACSISSSDFLIESTEGASEGCAHASLCGTAPATRSALVSIRRANPLPMASHVRLIAMSQDVPAFLLIELRATVCRAAINRAVRVPRYSHASSRAWRRAPAVSRTLSLFSDRMRARTWEHPHCVRLR